MTPANVAAIAWCFSSLRTLHQSAMSSLNEVTALFTIVLFALFKIGVAAVFLLYRY